MERVGLLAIFRFGTPACKGMGDGYFLKSTNVPGSVVGVVGNPNGDYTCWERPEDMDTPRTSYIITKQNPGSEVSAETAAALAASSMVFRGSDNRYSALLLNRAIEVFEFADKYRGSYNNSIPNGACPFYCDYNGYMDELVWGATWLYKATKRPYYWGYVKHNIHNLGRDVTQFGWDVKNVGIHVLSS
ncbi:putative cellulase [Rosa chinensis]|uniref:cellulase n=1 Tax=Rosa chinensis TaxID=74649 RepID=A0A2P6S1K9_ROSCH|nr:endoglucanase 17 [Rosa chinensis]PRQ52574.1 putative cellulase [Rosa chinensis]